MCGNRGGDGKSVISSQFYYKPKIAQTKKRLPKKVVVLLLFSR